MMTQPTTPSTSMPTPPLTERALLVSLQIHEWGAQRFDRFVSDQVARDHGAEPTAAGRYTKFLIPKEFLAPIRTVRNEARALHRELTLPWLDDGFRILPVSLHLQYTEKFQRLRTRFETAVTEFIAAYGRAKSSAKTTLGAL